MPCALIKVARDQLSWSLEILVQHGMMPEYEMQSIRSNIDLRLSLSPHSAARREAHAPPTDQLIDLQDGPLYPVDDEGHSLRAASETDASQPNNIPRTRPERCRLWHQVNPYTTEEEPARSRDTLDPAFREPVPPPQPQPQPAPPPPAARVLASIPQLTPAASLVQTTDPAGNPTKPPSPIGPSPHRPFSRWPRGVSS
ncbi:hypothetical protein QBC33DRAFT_618356 [Phialemonium atrogriseum]|uniref:Uncharacterized protein n=1 Tax=Phialemonium atrogriseum TaxID=1093897 RepID=A0AAJ0C482_9PEZI|nr:uncharacterized protein QBC33DRAFT_618356 [Phialemonium atrogriseum]KAK1768813.1 hypothetical protein QBC33DRAFT_618356 [Phialemonium atrogriseum]